MRPDPFLFILESEYDSPLKEVIASTILGCKEFVNEVSKRKLGGTRDARNVPAVKELALHPSFDEIRIRIKEEPVDERLLRNLSIYFCQKFSGAKLKEIGAHFGISDAAVSQASRRLALKAEKDQVLKKLIRRLEENWSVSEVET